MNIAAIANTVAVEYLKTVMPRVKRTHVSVLRCCILNAITDGITDDAFIKDVGNNPIYSQAAKTVFSVVGNDIGMLIGKTQEAARGTPS